MLYSVVFVHMTGTGTCCWLQKIAGQSHSPRQHSVVHVVQLHKDPLPNALGHVDNIFDTATDQAPSTLGMAIDDLSGTAAAAAPGRDPLLQGERQTA